MREGIVSTFIFIANTTHRKPKKARKRVRRGKGKGREKNVARKGKEWGKGGLMGVSAGEHIPIYPRPSPTQKNIPSTEISRKEWLDY